MTGLEKKALYLALFLFTLGVGVRIYRTTGENSGDLAVVHGLVESFSSQAMSLSKLSSVEEAKLIPKIDEKIKVHAKKVDKPIRINYANIQELTRIKGVGPKLAQAIATFRDKKGKFSSLSDLLKVKGIGKKKLQTMSNQITFVK